MATQKTPPWNMDVSKIMAEFKVPNVDLDSLMQTQRRNVEALTAANQLAMEGFQAVARRQADILRQSIEDVTSLMHQLMDTATPEARIAKQVEMTKDSFEKILANMKELSEMISKSNAEAADVINKRIGTMLDELKTSATKR